MGSGGPSSWGTLAIRPNQPSSITPEANTHSPESRNPPSAFLLSALFEAKAPATQALGSAPQISSWASGWHLASPPVVAAEDTCHPARRRAGTG